MIEKKINLPASEAPQPAYAGAEGDCGEPFHRVFYHSRQALSTGIFRLSKVAEMWYTQIASRRAYGLSCSPALPVPIRHSSPSEQPSQCQDEQNSRILNELNDHRFNLWSFSRRPVLYDRFQFLHMSVICSYVVCVMDGAAQWSGGYEEPRNSIPALGSSTGNKVAG